MGTKKDKTVRVIATGLVALGLYNYLRKSKPTVSGINDPGSKLMKYVKNWLTPGKNDWIDPKGRAAEVLEHGCVSGIVGELIYYSDTIKFYKKHQKEINELLYDTLEQFGTSDPTDVFGKKWDSEDPLALEQSNQNLLAWFGFEETVRVYADNKGWDI